MQTVTMPATYSNWVFIPSKELNIERSIKVIITVQYEEEKLIERDEYGFTEKWRKDLQKALDEEVLQSYSDVHSLIDDLRKNAIR